MLDRNTKKAMSHVAKFYDERKVGDVGALGFRRSSSLFRLVESMDSLIRSGVIVPGKTRFMDMGCADGRVNVLFSYIAETSVGVELNDWILNEHDQLRKPLEKSLAQEGLPLPPDNIFLFCGDTLSEKLHGDIEAETGLSFGGFDLFYTFITMHDEFADLIARKAKAGATFLVYGFDLVLPKYENIAFLGDSSIIGKKLAVYRKRIT